MLFVVVGCKLVVYAAGRLTPDDLFSSDLSDEEIEALFAHVNIPTLWVWSMKDEYGMSIVSFAILSHWPRSFFALGLTPAANESPGRLVSCYTLQANAIHAVPGHVDKRRHGERMEWAVKCDSEAVFIEVSDCRSWFDPRQC